MNSDCFALAGQEHVHVDSLPHVGRPDSPYWIGPQPVPPFVPMPPPTVLQLFNKLAPWSGNTWSIGAWWDFKKAVVPRFCICGKSPHLGHCGGLHCDEWGDGEPKRVRRVRRMTAKEIESSRIGGDQTVQEWREETSKQARAAEPFEPRYAELTAALTPAQLAAFEAPARGGAALARVRGVSRQSISRAKQRARKKLAQKLGVTTGGFSPEEDDGSISKETCTESCAGQGDKEPFLTG